MSFSTANNFLARKMSLPDLATKAPKSKYAEEEAILKEKPLGERLRLPFSDQERGILQEMHRMIFVGLCIASFGKASFDKVWAAIQLVYKDDDRAWESLIEQMNARLNTLILMVSFIPRLRRNAEVTCS